MLKSWPSRTMNYSLFIDGKSNQDCLVRSQAEANCANVIGSNPDFSVKLPRPIESMAKSQLQRRLEITNIAARPVRRPLEVLHLQPSQRLPIAEIRRDLNDIVRFRLQASD